MIVRSYHDLVQIVNEKLKIVKGINFINTMKNTKVRIGHTQIPGCQVSRGSKHLVLTKHTRCEPYIVIRSKSIRDETPNNWYETRKTA